jgi:hypothetical protein
MGIISNSDKWKKLNSEVLLWTQKILLYDNFSLGWKSHFCSDEQKDIGKHCYSFPMSTPLLEDQSNNRCLGQWYHMYTSSSEKSFSQKNHTGWTSVCVGSHARLLRYLPLPSMAYYTKATTQTPVHTKYQKIISKINKILIFLYMLSYVQHCKFPWRMCVFKKNIWEILKGVLGAASAM